MYYVYESIYESDVCRSGRLAEVIRHAAEGAYAACLEVGSLTQRLIYFFPPFFLLFFFIYYG